MKKKALSFDEKRERLLNIFHEKKEVFNLKELEKLGAKAGIVLQTVKDVLDSLVCDNLVESDKIGAGNFFWSLPSKQFQTLDYKIRDYNENIKKMNENKDHIEGDIADELIEKQETEERLAKLEELRQLKQQYEQNLAALDKYKRNDPERLKQLEKEAVKLRNQANQWTDNVFVTKQWIINKNPSFSDAELNKQFNIPDELDNI